MQWGGTWTLGILLAHLKDSNVVATSQEPRLVNCSGIKPILGRDYSKVLTCKVLLIAISRYIFFNPNSQEKLVPEQHWASQFPGHGHPVTLGPAKEKLHYSQTSIFLKWSSVLFRLCSCLLCLPKLHLNHPQLSSMYLASLSTRICFHICHLKHL